MRVDRLLISDFNNLKNFTVDFDETSPRQVVVGRNGVGKSNLLEALAQIFRELDLEEEPSFGYEIEYHCSHHFVRVISEKKKDENGIFAERFVRSFAIFKEESGSFKEPKIRKYKAIKPAEFFRRNRTINGRINPDRILPHYVFGYYSGFSDRFNAVFSKHEENYFQEQVSGSEAPLRPLFLAKPHHSQFALLSFFAAQDESAKKFLLEEFGIEKLESVLFSLHEPYWKKPKEKSGVKIDQRFWGAGGKVKSFLDTLFHNAFCPMAGRQRKKVSVGQEKTLERRFFYIQDEKTLRLLSEGLEPKEFFARLESTIFSDLISSDGNDVKIRIKLVDSEEAILFPKLSEGERQLLTIIGLMRFTAQNEGLFLLDEPDTFLNPAWCLDFLENLRIYGVEPPNSQIIMTTHSPLTFAGLDKNEVVIIEKGEDGRVFSQHPVTSPKGMGFQAILTSDFFRLRSTLDKDTLKDLDRKRFLALKEPRTEEEENELIILDEKLGKLDFSKATRDPLYLEFIKAMTKAQDEVPGIGSASPKNANWVLRRKIAQDIAKTIKEKEEVK